MGDDPYDFEIAIPAAGGGGAATQRSARAEKSKSYYGGSSDEGGSSSDVDLSDEDEEDESVDVKLKPKLQTQPSTRGAASAAASSSSSSALDKAKNFLSKYSTKAVDTKVNKTPLASARSSRRVELSLDGSMDFSPDEDDDDDVKPTLAKKTSKAALKTTLTTGKRVSLSDSEDYGVSSIDEPHAQRQSVTNAAQKSRQPVARTTTDESGSDDDDAYRTRSGASRVTANTPSAPVVTTTSPKAESDYDDEDEDAVASFMDESEEDDPPPFSATVSSKSTPAPTATKTEPQTMSLQLISKATPISKVSSEAGSDGDEAEEEANSASQSDYVESFDDEDSPPTTSAKPSVAVIPLALAQENFDKEKSFDEESNVTPSTAAAAAPPPLSRNTNAARKSPLEESAKSEPNFDYSMDFSDDNGGGEASSDAAEAPEPSMRVIFKAEAQPACERSSSSPSRRSDASGRSKFLESDHSDDDGAKAEHVSHIEQQSHNVDDRDSSSLNASNSSEPELGEVATAATAVSTIRTSPDSETRAAVDIVGQHLEHGSVVPEAISSRVIVENTPVTIQVELSAGVIHDTSRTLNEPPPRSLPAATVSTTRSRVLIVREYKQPRGERAEMKDATTQFTGNHAAIQADVTPDGMHNLVAEPSIPEKAPSNLCPQSTVQNPVPEQRSQPVGASCCAASPLLASPGYSMDTLRLPSATTTSIYKQQLLALQELILVKKRETERLVHERMSFQYSSLRGTERFLSSSRPGKLELWQALIRVDPTLTERKAREIAHLTNENAAA